MGFSEKRKYNRLKHPFIAKFRICKKEGSKESQKWDMVIVRNLSASGISFNYNKKIPIGTVLEFNIGLSYTLGSVCCLGEVCRIDESLPGKTAAEETPLYGIAAHFIKIEEDKKEAINALIEEFRSRQKR